jgi:hypothetical protein
MSMRTILLLLVLLAAAAPLAAEDRSAAEVIADVTTAMSGSDSGAKRMALLPLIALGSAYDDDVYRLLVQAVADQQTHDIAIPALRARSGLNPTFFDHGPGYPSYPASDAAADWNAWLAARSSDKARERTLADLSHRLAALDAASATHAPAAAAPAAAADAKKARAGMPPAEDATGLSRIIFTDGAIMVGRIIDRHRDAAGNELSVEFIHRDGSGREVIPIDRIARIESYVP